MSHIASIGAGMFSDMAIAFNTTGPTPPPSSFSKSGYDALFAAECTDNTPAINEYIRIQNVREFPAIGTPPNIVNVPVFGQSVSQQIQGQADAPSMEITLNYVASQWADGTPMGDLVGSGKQAVFRFALLNAEPASYHSAAAGLGAVENTYWYFNGKIDSLLVTPSLTDSNQATIAITLQSVVWGAFTVSP
jgi:hypothetical protein